MSEKDLARQADISVRLAGVDISDDIKEDLISLSFTDNEEDETDDLQIKLEDREGRWLQKWLNDTIDAAGTASGYVTVTETDTVVVNDSRAGIRNVISNGSSGLDAAVCQSYLVALGYDLGTTGGAGNGVDGKAGSMTIAAIKKYQQDNKLSRSGKCDRATWKRLTAAVQGMTIPKYAVSFKAAASVTLRASASKNAKKLDTIKKGELCVVTDKVASGWYAVTYGTQSGVAQGSSLKIDSVAKSTTQRETNKTKGLIIKATITRLNWLGDGKDSAIDCGMFELDNVKASGPPSSITIKGTSLSYSDGIRTTKRSKAWEAYYLSGIGGEIARNSGMALMFESEVDPYYRRVEQANQTNIAFLQVLCHNAGFSLKVTNNMIVIFDQARYEQLAEILTIEYGDGSYTKWDLSTSEGDVHYAVCHVSYTDPATGKTIDGYAYAEDYKEDDEENQTLSVTNQKVSSISEANTLAEKLLRLHNKYEKSSRFTMPGNPMLTAGLTVVLKKFGAWDGKYIIKQAKHQVASGGYTTQITLRRVLNQ